MRQGILAAAGVGAMLIAAPALAGADNQTSQSNVTYEDLDLSTEAGQKELDQRITIAARKTCGLNPYQSRGSGRFFLRNRKESLAAGHRLYFRQICSADPQGIAVFQFS